MKTLQYLWLFILSTQAFHTGLNAQSGPPWIKYNVGYNYIFRGIDFPGNQNNIGFMAGESLTYNGDGIVLKTTDGGATWAPVWTGTNEGLEGSSFPDVNTGFVAGWPKQSAGWSGFAKTTNGGATWNSLPVVNDVYYFTDVVFKDANNGILLGSTNTSPGVWVTSNGGISWTTSTGISSVPYHGCHISGNTYFLVDNAGHIQKSVNNGQSWTTVYTIPGLLLLGIDFFDDNHGMAAGDNGVILVTTDGGTTWTSQQVGTDLWHDFGWETQDHVFVCGTPEIVGESEDGGLTWGNGFPQSTYQAALYECIFRNDGWGFICGSQGTLLKRVPSCTADFTASAVTTCTANPVLFTNLSIGSNLTYSWWFEGGTPSSSSDPNPSVVYYSTGTFDVRLIVNNGFYSDTLLKTDYLTILPAPQTPVITVAGQTLRSNTASGNQWYFGGVIIPGANNQEYTASQSGWYWDVILENGCISDTSNNIFVIMTEVFDHSLYEISVSPGTRAGRFTIIIHGLSESSCTISVFSVNGIEVYREETALTDGSASKTIDLGTFPAGPYFAVIQTGKERILRKVVTGK